MREVFARLREGDGEALGILYGKYYDKMFGIAFSFVKNEEDCKDVVHSVMCRFTTMDKGLFPERAESVWLYRVIKNECIGFIRKQSKTVCSDELQEIAAEEKDIREFTDMDEFYSTIKNLDERRQKIVTLKILGGYTHKEISEMLGIPTGTVQWLYSTSVSKLRKLIGSTIVCIIAFVGLLAGLSVKIAKSFLTSGVTAQSQSVAIYLFTAVVGVLLTVSIASLVVIIKKSDY